MARIVHRVRKECDTMERWINAVQRFNMLWIICEGPE